MGCWFFVFVSSNGCHFTYSGFTKKNTMETSFFQLSTISSIEFEANIQKWKGILGFTYKIHVILRVRQPSRLDLQTLPRGPALSLTLL